MSIKSPLSRQFGSRFDSVFDVVKSNPVYDKVSRIPTLDLDFAKTKSLYDGRSTKNLIDFARDTAPNSSTYVDAAGLIKRSVTNLVPYSEDYSQWSQTALEPIVTGQTAPDGTNTASLLIENSDTSAHKIQRAYSVTSGKYYTYSLYVKSYSGIGELKLQFSGSGFASASSCIFNVSGSVNTGDGSVTDVGNGWYRISTTHVADGTGSTNYQIILRNSERSATDLYAGDGTSGIYIWGAQVEEASTAGEYVKTTSTKSGAPRFDHDSATGESLGLLVEESRENLLTYSEDFSQAIYVKSNITASSYAEDAPDGSQTAALFLETTTAAAHFVYNNVTQAITQGTASVWVKPLGRSFMSLRQYYTTDNWVVVVFDVTGDGEVSDIQYGSSTGYTNVSADITSYPNGWYRVSVTSSNSQGLDLPLVIHTNTSGTPTLNNNGDELFAGDTTKGFYIWGAQLEEGDFPTSYIPTEGAAVTRGADVASISGTNFSSWYDVNGGTVFSEFNSVAPADANTIFTWTFWNSAQDYLAMRTASGYSPDRLVAISRSDGSTTFTSETNANGYLIMPIGMTKGAFAFVENSFGIAWKGGTSFGATSGAIPSGIAKLDIGSQNGSVILNGRLKRITYWDARVANEKLQSVTS